MTNTRYLILPILTTLLIWTLNNPIGKLPPLGKFLDPFHGYLALVGSDDLKRLHMDTPQLESPVTVIFDSLRIPHIFTENDSSNRLVLVVISKNVLKILKTLKKIS